MGGDDGFAVTGRQCGHRIRMAERDGQMIEPMRIFPLLLRRHLQHHRIERQSDSRHGDAVGLVKSANVLISGLMV